MAKGAGNGGRGGGGRSFSPRSIDGQTRRGGENTSVTASVFRSNKYNEDRVNFGFGRRFGNGRFAGGSTAWSPSRGFLGATERAQQVIRNAFPELPR